MISESRVRQIQDKSTLLNFLREELGWPIPEDAEFDDLTFEWSSEELRISGSTGEKLKSGTIHQLQPFVTGQPWGIFLVEFADQKVYASSLREILRSLVPNRKTSSSTKQWHHENLLFICFAEGQRFTFAHFRGDKAQRSILSKFSWTPDEPIRTLCEYNLPPLKFPDDPSNVELWLDAWQTAFDVEKVTGEFFDAFEQTFEKVEEEIKGLRASERKNLFTLRLFNRLMFIRFIEKKGWLRFKGSANYLEALWADYKKNATSTSSFYDSRLKKLFFFALNNLASTDLMKRDEDGILKALVGEVPYLNGGLFDRHADDEDDKIKIPDSAIEKIIIDLFSHYNFTVTESTPFDVEVAVDPEMLGKVFEKLITTRAKTGSYYTPKSIVSFMCKEALKGHLGGYHTLVDYGNAAGIGIVDARTILDRLRSAKIVDPACGSGAYLLGMLHELHALYRILDPLADEKTPTDDYNRKLSIITNNIYGVDLDPFAVDIARLRLWLTLAVEHPGDSPEPLPNLDFKVEIGDSLDCDDPMKAGQSAVQQHLIEQYSILKAKHVGTHSYEKNDISKEVQRLRGLLAEWAYPGEDVSRFDWAIDFAEVFAGGGFDIVLANPPYGASVEDDVRNLYFDKRTEGSQSKDTYGLFIARGLQLLKAGGFLSYIVSDTWRTIKSHLPLRKRLVTTTSVQHVLDLPPWVFDATVNTCILTLCKTAPSPEHELVAGDLRAIPNRNWTLLEANLLSVSAQGPDVQTTQYARYTYGQNLITSNESQPFFIASPRLFQKTFNSDLQQLGGDSGIAEAHHGISTGDNKKYVRALPGTRGGYPELSADMKMPQSEIDALDDDEKVRGVDKEWKKLKGCFVPFDKGGSSDVDDGWLPNFYVPTQYYINWAKGAIVDMKKNKGARWFGEEFFFKPGLTFSISGYYAPTFRLNSSAVFEAKGSCIFSENIDLKVLLAILCSRVARYQFKNFIKHTVDTSGDDIDSFRFPLPTDEIAELLKQQVMLIVEKQESNRKYPYHLFEQNELDRLVNELYGLDDSDCREIDLWYCRRYPKLAEAQGVMAEANEKHADYLTRCDLILSKPPEYWKSSPILKLIADGESSILEFKETLEADSNTGEKHQGVLLSALKTIAAFLNADGGTLLIGVADTGEIKGLDKDYKLCKSPTKDGFEQKLRDLLNSKFDPRPIGNITTTFHELPEGTVCLVEVKPTDKSIVNHLDKDVYVRDGNTTRKLEGADLTDWIQTRTRTQ